MGMKLLFKVLNPSFEVVGALNDSSGVNGIVAQLGILLLHQLLEALLQALQPQLPVACQLEISLRHVPASVQSPRQCGRSRTRLLGS